MQKIIFCDNIYKFENFLKIRFKVKEDNEFKEKSDVENVFKIMGITDKKVTVDLNVGDKVKITDGPFKNMIGKIASVDLDNKKVELLLDLFGQETSVDVETYQVSKF